MALEDVDSDGHCWYASAYGNMVDYATTTSIEFGTGETNTQTMISKWNSNAYGEQNAGRNDDMWGLSAVQNKAEEGWYVPSADEWGAFIYECGVKNWDYSSVSSYYWTSSQKNEDEAHISWHDYYVAEGSSNVQLHYLSVRLGTTY